MIISTYIEQFNSLKTAKMARVKAPHKPILLLSIIDLIERGVITSNHIELSEALERQFAQNRAKYVGDSLLFQAKIATPYWHLQNEPFWELVSFSGSEVTKSTMQGSLYSVNNLRKQVKYAEIENQLYILLQSEDTRAELRTILINTYLNDNHIQKADVAPMVMTISTAFLSIAS